MDFFLFIFLDQSSRPGKFKLLIFFLNYYLFT